MRSDDHESEDLDTQNDDYEATVLDFLDKEIAASSESQDDLKTQRDDVDVLVDSLLEEAIAVSNQQPVDRDAGSEDLDLLFSSLLGSQDEVPQVESKDAQREVHSRFGRTFSDIGSVDKESVNLHAAENAPLQEAAEMPQMQMPVSGEADSTEMGRDISFLPPAPENGKGQRDPDPAVAGSKTDGLVRALTSSLAPRKTAWSLQMVVVSAAFLCLLAGMGITYFAGFKSPVRNKSNTPLPPTAQTIPAKTDEQMPPHNAPNPGTPIKATPVPAARLSPALDTPAVSETRSGVNNPAPRKESKPTTTEPPMPPPRPSPGAGVSQPAAVVDKTGASAAPAADGSAGIPPPRATENASTLPAVQTQTLPVPTLTPAVPRATQNLEGLIDLNRPAIKPLPLPRDAKPAQVTSRVLPVYPELARKSHTTGTVVVDIVIDEQGKVAKATPVSGPIILQPEAVNAVSRWQFKPATLDGANVSSSIQVSVVFKEPK